MMTVVHCKAPLVYVDRWIPLTKASDADIFFDLCLNKRLSKQSLGWWFETPSRSLWRHCFVQLCLCSVLFVKRTRAILHSIHVNPPASIFPTGVIYNPKPSCAYMVIRGSQLLVKPCFERRCIHFYSNFNHVYWLHSHWQYVDKNDYIIIFMLTIPYESFYV